MKCFDTRAAWYYRIQTSANTLEMLSERTDLVYNWSFKVFYLFIFFPSIFLKEQGFYFIFSTYEMKQVLVILVIPRIKMKTCWSYNSLVFCKMYLVMDALFFFSHKSYKEYEIKPYNLHCSTDTQMCTSRGGDFRLSENELSTSDDGSFTSSIWETSFLLVSMSF